METTELIGIVKEAIAKEFIDWRPLMKAVKDDPVDIDSPCKVEGCTLLQWGLENDSDQAAGIAITLGASVNAKGVGKFDCTPLDIAARKQNEKYTDMLIRYGGVASTEVVSRRMELLEAAKKARSQILENGKADSFKETIRRLETLLGVKGKADKNTGFIRFSKVSSPAVLGLTGKRSEQLEQVTAAFRDFVVEHRNEGAILYCNAWLGESLKKCELLLAATDSDVDLLTSMACIPNNPLYGNHQLLEPLIELSQQVPIQLLSINSDAIIVSFPEGVEEPKKLAKITLELFPFLVDYYTAGSGSPSEIDVHEIVTEEIRDESCLSIIYHSF